LTSTPAARRFRRSNFGGEAVAIEDCDAVAEFAQHTAGGEAGEAAANHNRVRGDRDSTLSLHDATKAPRRFYKPGGTGMPPPRHQAAVKFKKRALPSGIRVATLLHIPTQSEVDYATAKRPMPMRIRQDVQGLLRQSEVEKRRTRKAPGNPRRLTISRFGFKSHGDNFKQAEI
jgi:hypothetical protein